MKVRRVWECECGETILFDDVSSASSRWIVKGNGFLSKGADHGGARVTCRGCSRHHIVAPIAIHVTESLKKLWECSCTLASVLVTQDGVIVIRGEGHAQGYHATHARCRKCGNRYRFAPDIIHHHELTQKAAKREKSRKNRRAAKRRERHSD